MIEMLIYTAILVILAMVVVNVFLGLRRSTTALSATQVIESSAIISLERMTREIRDATSVDTGLSTLGTSPGVLQLNTTDAGGTPTTVQFYVSGRALRIKEAGTDIGPLTATTTRITNLVFRKITTAQSQAVKIEMTLESGTSTSYRQKKFYSTVVLRGSYPVQ